MTDTITTANRRTLIRRSVKRDDTLAAAGGGLFQILVPYYGYGQLDSILPPQLPVSWRDRDRILARTPRADAMWGAAIGIAVTKVASLAWDVESDIPLRARRAQQLLLHADSVNGMGGWIQFISKQVRDFITTNNGCFAEIVRATNAYGSRVIGLNHLSSLRCWRTGDPETPVLYWDRLGHYHLLKWYEVISIASLPEPINESICYENPSRYNGNDLH